MAGPAHLPAGRPLALLDCHLEDQQLLVAYRVLRGSGPLNELAWNVLRQAARRGDLFIVTRQAGDSLERLAKAKKRRTAP